VGVSVVEVAVVRVVVADRFVRVGVGVPTGHGCVVRVGVVGVVVAVAVLVLDRLVGVQMTMA
jgi:hypothetical protein